MGENGPVTTPETPRKGAFWRRLDREKLVVSAGVAVGIFLIFLGFSSATTGRESQRLPAEVESLTPGPGDQVLRQSQIFVDLVEGYQASLKVDGIVLETTRLDELTSGGAAPKPGAQVEVPPTAIFDPGNYTISFLPQEGAPITEFAQGKHTVTITFWKITDGPSKARSFTWEFEAN